MHLTDDFETFRSENGSSVILPKGYGGTTLLSSDGNTFYAVKQTGLASETSPGFIKQGISFEDPHHAVRGRIERENDVLELDDTTYTKVENPLEITVIPLPVVRTAQYFYRLRNDDFIYVDVDKYNFTYGSHRFFIGNGATMRHLPIIGFERLRDGGTTYITTDEGILYSPSAFRRGVKATWNDEDLIELNPQDNTIIETGDGLTIK